MPIYRKQIDRLVQLGADVYGADERRQNNLYFLQRKLKRAEEDFVAIWEGRISFSKLPYGHRGKKRKAPGG